LHRYFGAFDKHTLENFYQSFEQWELEGVLEVLANAGISLHNPDSSRPRTLSDAPSAVVYNMVANLTILKDPRILSFIRSLVPSQPLPGWPTDPLPAGLLILMLDEVSSVRRWARNQAARCTIVPIPKEKFVGSYRTAVQIVVYALSLSDHGNTSASPPFPLASDSHSARSSSPFSFAIDIADLWSGFCAVLRLIPPESLSSNTHQYADLRRIVANHLNDTGPR
jgi:senataxin